jgi:glycosyltransferase involved in cell wall biosynthesis
MDAMNGLISVIIPSFNRSKDLKKALESVFVQTYTNLEIIIVDDASTDDTQSLIKDIIDPRIIYVRHSHNQGGGAARNTGIGKASGEYIAFLDSDDVWISDKLEEQINLFHQLDSSYGVVYCSLQVYESGQKKEIFQAKYSGFFLYELLAKNYIGTLSSVLIRKKYLQEVKGLDPFLKSCQDWDLYIRLMKICQFAYVEKPLVEYYINKLDAVRISNNRKSIIHGHELFFNKFKFDYDNLPLKYRIQHMELKSEIYLSGGDLKKAISLLYKLFLSTSNFKYSFRILWYCGRFLKKQFLTKYGY